MRELWANPMTQRELMKKLEDVGCHKDDLEKSLNLQSRPEAAIHPFYQIFQDCLAINSKELSQYEMPQSLGVLDDEIYTTVRSSDWWHRRIIDIAVLLHLNVTKAAIPLPTIP